MMMIHPSIYSFPSTPTTSSPRSRGHKPLINLHPPISIQRFTLNPCSTRPLSSLCIYYTNQKLLHRKLRSAFFIFHFSIFIFHFSLRNFEFERRKKQNTTTHTFDDSKCCVLEEKSVTVSGECCHRVWPEMLPAPPLTTTVVVTISRYR